MSWNDSIVAVARLHNHSTVFHVCVAWNLGSTACQPSLSLHLSPLSLRCAICMMEFAPGEAVRFLPCMHYYHIQCVDGWLMRALTCPTCMERVDLAILANQGLHMQPMTRPGHPPRNNSTSSLSSESSQSSHSSTSTGSALQVRPARLILRRRTSQQTQCT